MRSLSPKFAVALILWLPLAAVTVVKNGRSEYSICVGAEASPSEKRGAQELQRFLEEMSGAKLPVIENCDAKQQKLVFVGASPALRQAFPEIDAEAEGPEGFRIKTAGRHLAIAGGRLRGTMYGVYTFLDRLGCRWFTSEVSRIPKKKTIETGALDLHAKPDFEYREPFFTEAFEKEWAARNRTNGNSSKLDESTGGKVLYYPFVHSFNALIPPDKYFKDHPEYFSLIEGKRRAERSQLCLTNAEVLRLAVARVEEWIKEHPEASIISVSQNDWEGWCECDECRRVEEEEGGAHIGPVLRFVSSVADEIGKRHPGKLIDTLAYWYTEDPPAKARPRPNVRIRLCPIGVCEAHPYEQCPRSAYFVKNLKAWAQITNQLYIWHYNTNFSHYLSPFPDFDELAANIPLYKRNGVVGVFLEGAYPAGGGGELSELRSYVMARQMWDASTNVDAAVIEFLEGVYGPAARPMRAYYDLIHRQVRPAPRGRGEHIWIFNLPEFTPGFVKEARALFAKADAAAGNDEIRKRLRKAALPVEYFDLTHAKAHEFKDGVFAPQDLDGLKRRWTAFLDSLAEFGIESIHEGRDLKTDRQMVEALRAWNTVTLENGDLRADIVPRLGGRVLRMIDKKTGRNLLRVANPGEGGYPNIGGFWLNAHPDYVSRAWEAAWDLGSSSASEVVLEGHTIDGRVSLKRQIWLRGSSVAIASEARNESAGSLEMVLQARADFEPVDIDAAAVEFRSGEGKDVAKKLIVADEQPTGNINWQGREMPAGAWRVSAGGRGVAESRFEPGEVSRTTVNWTAKGRPRVSLAVWSKAATLASKETLRLGVEYSPASSGAQ